MSAEKTVTDTEQVAGGELASAEDSSSAAEGATVRPDRPPSGSGNDSADTGGGGADSPSTANTGRLVTAGDGVNSKEPPAPAATEATAESAADTASDGHTEDGAAETTEAAPEAAERATEAAEVATEAAEETSSGDAPVGDRSVTPTEADAGAAVTEDSGAAESEPEAEASSPLRQIKVISAATVSTLEGSEDEDDPVEPTNGAVSGSESERDGRRSPSRRSRRAAAGRASSSIKKIITREGSLAQDKSKADADKTADVTNDSPGVVAENTADKSQPAMYGIVTPLYKETATKSMRPLAVRPLSGLAVSAATTAVSVVTTNATNSSAALLSSRQSRCIICNWVKPIKYMMMANGSTSGNVICSDECLEKCVNSVKATGRINVMSDSTTVSTTAVAPAPVSSTITVASVTALSAVPASAAPVGVSLQGRTAQPVQPVQPAQPAPLSEAAPSAGRGRTVCQNSECGRPILPTIAGRQQRTVWETQVFCSPACTIQHQKKDGAACVFCKVELPEMMMGKYCVRFGSDVRQFCSNLCLDGFKKRLKVCSYCQRDITRFQGSFLAPVGAAGSHQFKEFCSQTCLTRYKTTHGEAATNVVWHKCAVCLKNKPVEHRVAVKPNESVKQLCSQPCLKAYKFAIKDEGELETCAVCKSQLVADNMSEYRVWHGSSMAHLCSQSCSNVFVLSNRRIVSCRYCKVKKYNFDMMEVAAEKDGLYCSVHCLKNCGKRIVPSSKATKCAQCGAAISASAFTSSSGPNTMFCGKQCALTSMKEKAAQNKYVRIAPGPASTPPSSAAPASNGVDHSRLAAPPLPLIQSVVSLADGEEGEQQQEQQQQQQQQEQQQRQQQRQREGEERLLPAARHHPAVVLVPPEPVLTRNVSVQVRPRRPDRGDKASEVEKEARETATIATQTDPVVGDDGRVLPIPVPIPFYVPAPMAMYNCPYPVPVPLVLPVPVPLLCGGEDALRLLCGQPGQHNTRQLQQESSPRTSAAKRRRPSAASSDCPSPGPEQDLGSDGGGSTDLGDLGDLGEPGDRGDSDSDSRGDGDTQDAETSDQPPRKRRKVEGTSESPPPVSVAAADGRVDLAALMRAPPTIKSRLNYTMDDYTMPRGTEFLGPNDASYPCHRSAVKYTWCVRVFEQFVRERNGRPADGDGAGGGAQDRLVADPLQASPDQLSAGLSVMTRELRRPNGQPYPPDLIHYIVLGVQLFLLENGRRDSLFWGDQYEELGAALEERLQPAVDKLQLAELNPRAHMVTTHIEEQHLWQAKVLGPHTPQSLLTTVMFFVTKHFLLGSVQWHEKLSFGMIQESIALKSRLQETALKLLDSDSVYKRKQTYEMPANVKDPYRCPVKFLEFYISRCPESARSGGADSPLYLTPASDGRPDGSVWFSAVPLPAAALRRLLSRLLTVRELQTALLFDTLS